MPELLHNSVQRRSALHGYLWHALLPGLHGRLAGLQHDLFEVQWSEYTYCMEGCAAAKKGCAGSSGNRMCDNGCIYSTTKQKCETTISGSVTGCVLGIDDCALCYCKGAEKMDCWCQK